MTKSTKAKLAYQAEYNARPENIKKRVENNAARRKLMAEGRVHKGDGKDVAHKVALDNGGGNQPSNLEVETQAKNRGWRKGNPTNNPDAGKKK